MRGLLLFFCCVPTLLLAGQGHLEGWAEWLYWKPSTQGAFFGTATLFSGEEKVLYVKPKFKSGGQVGVRHTFCDGCHDLQATYTTVSANQIGRSHDMIDFPPLGSGLVGATARVDFDYRAADLVVGASFVRRYVLVLRLFAGIEWVQVTEKQDFLYDMAQRFRRKLEFEAAGPLFGIGAEYCVWNRIKLTTELGVAALFGSRRVVDNFYPTSNIVTPGFRAKVGLNYTYCFSCLTLRGELGVAVRHYPNALTRTLQRGSALEISLEDITYGGPYASITARF